MEELVILGLILYLLRRRSYVRVVTPNLELYGGTLTSTRSPMFANTTAGYVYATVFNEGVVNSIMVYHVHDGEIAYQSEITGGQSKRFMMAVDDKLYGSSYMTNFGVDYSLSIQYTQE